VEDSRSESRDRLRATATPAEAWRKHEKGTTLKTLSNDWKEMQIIYESAGGRVFIHLNLLLPRQKKPKGEKS
jgi:hypothetical protein